MDRWRDDPEPTLIREIDLTSARDFGIGVTMRVDARAPDAELAALFGWPVVADSRLTGSPRHAGVAAFDDDPDTAWITAFDRARGATLTTRSDAPIDSIEVEQPVAGFSSVRSMIVRSGAEEREVVLTPDALGVSVAPVDPPLPPGEVTFSLGGLDAQVTVDRRFADPVELPAAISELRFAGRPQAAAIGTESVTIDCTPVATVADSTVAVTVEITDAGWLDGAALDVVPCAESITLPAGTSRLTTSTDLPLTVDQLTLDDGVRQALDALPAAPSVEVLAQGRFDRTVRVDGCADGCWLVVGEGHNEAWTASGADGSLGPSRPVDGGFNGWWIEPSDAAVTIDVTWTAQRGLDWALIATVIAALVAITLVVAGNRSRQPALPEPPTPRWSALEGRLSDRSCRLTAVWWAVLAGLLVGPVWAIWGAIGGLAGVLTRRRRLPELTALASLLVVATYVTVHERRVAPLPDGGWPTTFEAAHGLGMFAIASLLVGALVASDAGDADEPRTDPSQAGDDTQDETRDDTTDDSTAGDATSDVGDDARTAIGE